MWSQPFHAARSIVAEFIEVGGSVRLPTIRDPRPLNSFAFFSFVSLGGSDVICTYILPLTRSN